LDPNILRAILLEGYLLELISSTSNSSSFWIQTRPKTACSFNFWEILHQVVVQMVSCFQAGSHMQRCDCRPSAQTSVQEALIRNYPNFKVLDRNLHFWFWNAKSKGQPGHCFGDCKNVENLRPLVFHSKIKRKLG